MKKIFTVITALFLNLNAFSSDKLPPMDTSKPVYQNVVPGVFGVGGYWRKVEPVSADELRKMHKEEFDREQRRKMYDLGLWFLGIGLPMIFVGFFISALLKQYGLEMIAHFISPSGIGLACSGAVLRSMARFEVVIAIGVLLLIIYSVFSYLRRGKGLLTKRRDEDD